LTRKSLSLVAITILLLAVAALGASAAWAGGVNGLIEDASDGVVDGTYSASTVRAALTVVRGDPAYAQYSDIEGVMVDYLAAVTGSSGGGTSNPDGTGTSGTGSLGITSSSGGKASPSATGTPKGSPSAKSTTTATPTTTPSGGGTAATASPPPDTAGWEQTRSRLAAVPWLFALVAGGVIVAVILLRRRRRSS